MPVSYQSFLYRFSKDRLLQKSVKKDTLIRKERRRVNDRGRGLHKRKMVPLFNATVFREELSALEENVDDFFIAICGIIIYCKYTEKNYLQYI